MLVSRRLSKLNPRVRIVAPSSPFRAEHLQAGIEVMHEASFVVEDPTNVLKTGHAYLNGSDEERTDALMHALKSDVDIVWLARGGYGLTRILRTLHEKLTDAMPHFIKHGMPTVIGFSDATALFGLFNRLNLPCIHGPLATSLRNESAKSKAHLFTLLTGVKEECFLPCIPRANTQARNFSGMIFVGNLCVLSALVGTPFMPDLEGTLLVLEEIGERPYRIDRMLTQLENSGAFQGVNALVTGHLTGCDERAEGQVKATAEARFAELSSRLQLPWFSGLPVGHENPNFALPQGQRAELKIQGSSATFSF